MTLLRKLVLASAIGVTCFARGRLAAEAPEDETVYEADFGRRP